MKKNYLQLVAKLYESETLTEVIPTRHSTQLGKISSIKAVIFDVYGTLLISASGDVDVLQSSQKEEQLSDLLSSYEIKVKNESTPLHQQLVGAIKTKHKGEKLMGNRFPEVNLVKIWGSLLQEVELSRLKMFILHYECLVNPVSPMPEMRELLIWLSQNKFDLGIVSNGQFFTSILLEHFLDNPLDKAGFKEEFCVFSYREGLAKPGIEIYQVLKQRLANQEISPQEVLYVGNDMRNDIHPASQLGMKTILFAGDQRSLRLRKGEKLNSPNFIIDHLAQLKGILT